MNIHSSQIPFYPQTSVSSEQLASAYEETLKMIGAGQTAYQIDLSEEIDKARRIMQVFQQTRNAYESLQNLGDLRLQTSKILIKRKIELACQEIKEMADGAEKRGLKIDTALLEAAAFLLGDSKDCVPRFSLQELYVYEKSAQLRLGIAKSEITKRIILQRMQKIITDYQDKIDLDAAEKIFYAYTEKLHLSNAQKKVSTKDIDLLIDEFYERIEFLNPAITDTKSHFNKQTALKRMEHLMLEYQGRVEGEQARRIFDRYSVMIAVNNPKNLLSPDERDDLLLKFREELIFLNPEEARISSANNKAEAIKRLKDILLSNRPLFESEEALRLVKEYVAKVRLEDKSRLMTGAEANTLVTECLKAIEQLGLS